MNLFDSFLLGTLSVLSNNSMFFDLIVGVLSKNYLYILIKADSIDGKCFNRTRKINKIISSRVSESLRRNAMLRVHKLTL